MFLFSFEIFRKFFIWIDEKVRIETFCLVQNKNKKNWLKKVNRFKRRFEKCNGEFTRNGTSSTNQLDTVTIFFSWDFCIFFYRMTVQLGGFDYWTNYTHWRTQHIQIKLDKNLLQCKHFEIQILWTYQINSRDFFGYVINKCWDFPSLPRTPFYEHPHLRIPSLLFFERKVWKRCEKNGVDFCFSFTPFVKKKISVADLGCF